MGEDVGTYGGAFGVFHGLIDEFGEDRVRDTPISEAGIAGAATGAAVIGMRPVAEIMFVDFTTIAMDQLVNQAANIRLVFGGKAKVPPVLLTPARTGATAHHRRRLQAWFLHVPDIEVVMPNPSYDMKYLLLTLLREYNPVVFAEHKLLSKTAGPVPKEDYTIPLGVAEVKRPGEDVTILATSMKVHWALEAAEALAHKAIDVEVVEPLSLKPFNGETINSSAITTDRVLIVHEACKTGASVLR